MQVLLQVRAQALEVQSVQSLQFVQSMVVRAVHMSACRLLALNVLAVRAVHVSACPLLVLNVLAALAVQCCSERKTSAMRLAMMIALAVMDDGDKHGDDKGGNNNGDGDTCEHTYNRAHMHACRCRCTHTCMQKARMQSAHACTQMHMYTYVGTFM